MLISNQLAMPFVFLAQYQMEFAESAPLEVERFPLLSFQFIDFITLQKFSKGQSFITRLLFTGEKGAERLTLEHVLGRPESKLQILWWVSICSHYGWLF